MFPNKKSSHNRTILSQCAPSNLDIDGLDEEKHTRQATPFVTHNAIYCTQQTAAVLGSSRWPTLQCTMQPIAYDSSLQSEAHIAMHNATYCI